VVRNGNASGENQPSNPPIHTGNSPEGCGRVVAKSKEQRQGHGRDEGLHLLAFAILMLARFVHFVAFIV
jgi:hypothetical protein